MITRDDDGNYYSNGELIIIETPEDSKRVVRAFKKQNSKTIAPQGNSTTSAPRQIEWDDYKSVKGIGPKTIEKIKEFCNSDDPFGVHQVKLTLDEVRKAIADGKLLFCPVPSHLSIDIPPEREEVVYVGIARAKRYYDAVEQLQKRTTEEIDYAEALSRLDDPHLLKYAAIDVEDEYNESVRVRISRWKYPEFASQIAHLKLDKDVILVKGYSSDFGGTSIQAKELVVIEV
jgi:hypothetical protein